MTAQTQITDAPALTARQSAQFDVMLRANYRRVYAYAYRLTGCQTRAEDMTQETFVRAYRAFAAYDHARPVLHWLGRITHNLFIDGLRARKGVAPLSLDALHMSGDGANGIELQIADDRFNPEQVLFRDTLDERLERALQTLPADYRSTLLLCDAQGMAYEDIAALMQCSSGTVRSRIHRGRKMLQKAYAAQRDLPQTTRGRMQAALSPA